MPDSILGECASAQAPAPTRSDESLALSRSAQMSRIRGSNTQPELLLRDALVAAGFHPAQQARVEGVRPDFILGTHLVAIFIDGCFWHGCPTHYVRPRSRPVIWASKLRENVERDARQAAVLERAGWRVVRAWEHEVFEDLPGVVARVSNAAEGADAPIDERRVIQVDELDDPWQERRSIVQLRSPATVVEERVGRRVTAKWRRRRPTGLSDG